MPLAIKFFSTNTRKLDSCYFLQYPVIMKKLLLLLLLVAQVLAGCSGPSSSKDQKLQVMASFYPMADFARNIGGSYVEVKTMIPDGVEPHDWEPSPRDLTSLGLAQVFIYNGIVEPWAEPALEALKERKLLAVEAGANLYRRQGKVDPHVWISPKKALVQVDRIKEAFIEADPAHKAEYEKNAALYKEQLTALDKRLEAVAAAAPKKVFITAHAAFGHLAQDYGLEQRAIAGISPEAEPSPGDLKALVELVHREQVAYIFFETLGDPRISQMLAQETGAKISVLDPIEGLDKEGREAGLNYFKLMEQNIKNLEEALR